MYWNKEIECMSRKELDELKLRRLKETVFRVYSFVPSYKAKMDERGINPSDIQTLEDLEKLPYTTKQDQRDNYPFGLFAVPMTDVVRIHSSSGTTGKPTVVGYTKRDLDRWAELMARSLTCAGATRYSVVQNAYGYGLFTGGLGVHYGAEKIGASVIPSSGGNTKRQIMLMQDFGTTVLTCTPSYALFMHEIMLEMGIEPSQLKLKSGILGAEPWSENMRRDLENRLEIDAFDIYGLSEIMGPGVAIECRQKEGLHVFEDNFIVEIVNPETGETLPPGEKGELVLTTINKEALPMIRYRTRDLSSLTTELCSCGRTHVRMSKVWDVPTTWLLSEVNVFPTGGKRAIEYRYGRTLLFAGGGKKKQFG